MEQEAAIRLLEELGATNIKARVKPDGTVEVSCDCLSEITGHIQKDGNSASLNADKELYKCLSCGVGYNVPQLLLYSGLADFWSEALTKAKYYSSLPPEHWEFPDFQIPYGPKDKHLLVEVDPVDALSFRNTGHSYLTLPLEQGGRGVPARVWKELLVHYNPPTDSIRFPVIDHNGRLVGWIERLFPTSSLYNPDNKYQNSAGLRKTDVLYNFIGARVAVLKQPAESRKLIVSEGPGDIARWKALGYENVVSTLGCDPSQYQVYLLSQIGADELIIGYDNPMMDKGGAKGGAKLADLAAPYFRRIKYGGYRYGVKDPGSFSMDDADYFMANAKSPLAYAMDRASKKLGLDT